MADSNVPITAGSGTNIDTFTQAGGDHRQAMVLGDAVNADVAGVANGGLGVNGGTLLSTSASVAVGSSAVVAGPLDVSHAGNVTIIIKNTVAASPWAGTPSFVFEQSDDNVSWAALPVVRSDTGAIAASVVLGPGVANGSLTFDVAAEGISYVRVRNTNAPTTAGMTVVISAGGMPFPQGNAVLAVPTDGSRVTYISTSASATLTPALTAGASQPWLILQNAAASGVRIRVLRVRVELTIATAATVHLGMQRFTALSTGGTSTSRAGTSLEAISGSADSAAGSVLAYTVAPTANGSLGGISTQVARRFWVGLSTAAGGPYAADVSFGSGRPSRAVTLRPSEQFGIFWVAAPATAIAATWEIEWTEEPV